MIIVPKFELKYNEKKGVYSIISLVTSKCPLCSGAVYHRDFKSRFSKRCNGEVWQFRLRRLLCGECAKLHTEIPDIIQPFKHYDSETIQCILDGNEGALECDVDCSTIRRWKRDFSIAGLDIEQRLASVIAQESDDKMPLLSPGLVLAYIRATVDRWLAFVMCLLINGGHKLCTQFAFCPSRPSVKIHLAGNNDLGGYGKNAKSTEDTG
jgi:hypothetical protein